MARAQETPLDAGEPFPRFELDTTTDRLTPQDCFTYISCPASKRRGKATGGDGDQQFPR